jgi:esterase/lipase superfamily enzyme
MEYDFVMSARDVRDAAKFGDDPAPSQYLFVPEGTLPAPSQKVSRDRWVARVLAEARRGVAKREFGHLAFFVHGYNTGVRDMIETHRRLKRRFTEAGFRGVLVSFDWPSENNPILYLEDRVDAKRTALQLVSDGVMVLAEKQTPDCDVAIHVIGHSMGTLVVREAFDDADDRSLANAAWLTSQVVLFGADISAGSLSDGNPTSDSLYRHCVRFTNYSNRHDAVLALSNAKRVGIAPRAGRVGLPDSIPSKASNIDCSDYYEAQVKAKDKTRGHSWYIDDPVFAADVVATLHGVDREVMATRIKLSPQRFALRTAAV